MNYAHIIACLFALIGAVPAITLLSPVKVAHRAVPLIMIAVSLGLWFMPTGIDIAVALVPVAAYISSRVGIEQAGHDPVDVTKAVELAKRGAQRVSAHMKRPKAAEITEFVKRGDQGVLAAEDDGNRNDEDPAEDGPGDDQTPAEKMAGKLELAAQGLPAQYRDQLTGQRAGRPGPSGLRNHTTTAVRSFVPDLAG